MKNRAMNAKQPGSFHRFLIAPVLRFMDKMSGRDVPVAKKKSNIARRTA